MTRRWASLIISLAIISVVKAQETEDVLEDGEQFQRYQRQQQPGRIACGAATANQKICDALSHPSSRRAMRVPVNSECVLDARSGMHFCGYANARCSTDSQCDFGHCSGEGGKAGVCLGALGDDCQSPEGPDDSLCMGNLGCSPGSNGRAICGGIGSECLYTGSYVPGRIPNHMACISGLCDSVTLTCSSVPEVPSRQQRLRIELNRAAAESAVKSQNKKKEKANSVKLSSAQKQRQQQQQRLQQIQRQGARVEESEVPPAYKFRDHNTGADENTEQDTDEEVIDEEDDLDLAATTMAGLRQCPSGFTLCPVPSRRSNSIGLEEEVDWACFDTTSSVNQCGGCSLPHPDVPAHLANGEDCLLPSPEDDVETQNGIMNAACVQSRCRVLSCGPGAAVDRATGQCRPIRHKQKQ